MAAQINSGYIVDQGISTVFNLINNKAFDLSLFTFGVGIKSNYIFGSVDISDRVFTYASNTFTVLTGVNLPIINLTIYPYIVIRTNDTTLLYNVYKVLTVGTTTIVIDPTYNPYTGSATNITINGFADTPTVNTKYPEYEKQKRILPQYNTVVTNGGIVGNISSISKSIDIDNTIEINCEIPENPAVLTSIYFDEVYLYGRNDTEAADTKNLIFVAETIYGTGIYTGQESNLFNIRISLSNLSETSSITYNIDNLGVKSDIEVLQLMFIYILSLKDRNLRDLNAKMDIIDARLEEFRDATFGDKLFQRVSDYLYTRMNGKYTETTEPIYTLQLNLMDSVTIPNVNINTIVDPGVISDIVRVVGIVTKYIYDGLSSYFVGGYPQNTLFYIGQNTKLKAYDLDNLTDLTSSIRIEYSNLTFTANDVFNVNVLDTVMPGYINKNV